MVWKIIWLVVVVTLVGCAEHRTDGVEQSNEISAECQLTSNYIEALGENEDVLLNLLVMSQMNGSPLQDRSFIPSRHSQLTSIRRFHEDQRDTLPACAQSLNHSFTATVAAAQDLLTARLIWLDDSIDVSAEKRAAERQRYFVKQWSSYQEVKQRGEISAEIP